MNDVYFSSTPGGIFFLNFSRDPSLLFFLKVCSLLPSFLPTTGTSNGSHLKTGRTISKYDTTLNYEQFTTEFAVNTLAETEM